MSSPADNPPFTEEEILALWPDAVRDETGAWVLHPGGQAIPAPPPAPEDEPGWAEQADAEADEEEEEAVPDWDPVSGEAPPPPSPWPAEAPTTPTPVVVPPPSANGNPAAAPPASGLRGRLHVGEAVLALPPQEPLVEGLLFLPGESVLYSPPKRGKSFWSLHLSLCVATGLPFMGRPVEQGPVLYVAAEGVGGLGARVAAWLERYGPQDISGCAWLASTVNLLDRRSADALCDLAAERGALLTVIDTLHRCSAGAEENSAKDMGRVIESLDRLRNASEGHVLTVHHAGKDVTKGMRGSSALLGAVDTAIELSGDAQAIRCAVTDQKEAEPADPWWCALEQVGSSAVIAERGISEVMTHTQRTVLECAEELPPGERTSAKWKTSCEEAGISGRSFYRAVKELERRGDVRGGGGRGKPYEIVEAPPEEEEYVDEPSLLG